MLPSSTAALLGMLLPALFSGLAHAVPNVTVVPLDTSDCSNWPGLMATDKRHGPMGSIQFQVDLCDDDAVNGLLMASVNTTLPMGNPATSTSVTTLAFDLRKSFRFAKDYFLCDDGIMRYLHSPDAITINRDPRNAFLLQGYAPATTDGKIAPASYPLQAYAHVDPATGQRLPGVFLGAFNQTTWGFNFNNNGPCGLPFMYDVRLQGLPEDPETEPTATCDPWFFGFIRAITF